MKKLHKLQVLNMLAQKSLLQKIQNEGWVDFDVLITTPDMMGLVGRLGKVLGPTRPNAKPKSRYSYT